MVSLASMAESTAFAKVSCSWAVGLGLLTISIYTLPSDVKSPRPKWPAYIRLLLAPIVLWAFWDAGYGHFWPNQTDYEVPPPRGLYCVMSSFSSYFILRVIDTNIASAWDDIPPRWVSHDGKILPLPTTVAGRLAYTLDLLSSLRGASWYKGRHWDFAPPSIISYRSSATRLQFIKRTIYTLAFTYIFVDALDTSMELAPLDTSHPHPITRLSIPLQIFYTVVLCIWTNLGVMIYMIPLSLACIGLGLTKDPSTWPPMFDAPFQSSSIADFWANRWHQVFRRPFNRLLIVTHHLVSPIFDYERHFSQQTRRIGRVFLVFFISTGMHMAIGSRMPIDAKHPHISLWDWQVFRTFMLQPIGIILDWYIAALLGSGTGKGKAWLRRAFAWGWIVWSARWYADFTVRQGLWDHEVNGISWSLIRGILYGRWNV